MHKTAARIIVGLTFIAMVGCGSGHPTRHPVEGKILFPDGSTPTFGTVEFYNPEHKLNARGEIGSDGTFTVTTEQSDGAVAGKHDVIIMQVIAPPAGHLAEAASQIKHSHGALVAKKYFDYRTSGLTCEIKEGPNSVEFLVEKGGE